jgi:hypothetical protein
MTEKEVADQIKTPAVLRAFELAKISELPASVRANYEDEDVAYDRFSEYTAEQRKAAKLEGLLEGEVKGKVEGEVKGKLEGLLEGEVKGKVEVAKNLVKIGLPAHKIQEVTGLSLEVIESMK